VKCSFWVHSVTDRVISVPIEGIKELRIGVNARYYRQQFKLTEELEERWITIIYILDGAYRTLHIVADTRDIFQLWSTALQKLYAIRQGLMTGLGNVEMRQNVWERQYWKGADEEGDQVLDFDDIERLCKRLNVNITAAELTKLFKVFFVFLLPFQACANHLLGNRYPKTRPFGFPTIPDVRQDIEASP